ncbi:T9SS C-terminal target domain-containing protein [Flavihumibacter petaseus]|uniref:Gliding motility-associated C-terminal domain-containing protein n=1 Tax=Flavihumibacter petaseus NBRC 106054 TaxID=1220578 RepID=A0A0E9MVF9_9BACT|nr:T9SS C-terminal target domain-containing protein [Flavihumibacter petaseus]GAO41468.1 hypothetical protein FPE01S_01_04810 [Flavihumibacter petaseus NBRC 106054]
MASAIYKMVSGYSWAALLWLNLCAVPGIAQTSFPVDAEIKNSTCMQANGTITLNASGGESPYMYSITGRAFQSSGLFENLKPGYYTVGAKDASGLFVTRVVLVQNRDDPPEISDASAITPSACDKSDGSITLLAIGGMPPYLYSIDLEHWQESPVFTGLPAGNYDLFVKDAKGCTGSRTRVIINTCMLDIAISELVNSCAGDGKIAGLKGRGGRSPYYFSLDGGQFTITDAFENLSPGIHILLVKDAHGTVGAFGIQILAACTFNVQVKTGYTGCSERGGFIQLTPQHGKSPYLFQLDGGLPQPDPVFNNLSPGNYLVRATDVTGALWTAAVDVPGAGGASSFDLGADTGICSGTTLLWPRPLAGNQITWSPAAGVSDIHSSQPILAPAITTTYYVTIASEDCPETDSITIGVYPVPVANAGDDITLCAGQTATLTGSGGSLYQWSPADGLNDATIANPRVLSTGSDITWTLTVTDSYGCQSLPDQVAVHFGSTAPVFAGNDTTIRRGEPVTLQATDPTGAGFNQWTWEPAAAVESPQSPQTVSHPQHDQVFRVVATNGQGCTGIDEVMVKVVAGSDILFPTAFTPNNDKRNDFLRPIPIGMRELTSFQVFNRWGQEVFRDAGQSPGWNGEFNGKPQPTGYFVCIARGIDISGRVIEKKGAAMLVR